MSAAAATARLNWGRYLNSRGIWLLMLVAPIGARFWVPREDGTAMAVAVDGRLPVMTPAVVGLSLGVVVATSFLPIAWAYLRRNVTNVRAWQTEDVAAASSVEQTLGRFAADIAVLALMLAALTAAGCLLAWQTDDGGSPWVVAVTIWLIGFPPLVVLAGLRALVDSCNLTRGALGDVLFAVIWLVSLATPLAAGVRGTGTIDGLRDFAGFVRPLSSGEVGANHRLAVGVFPVSSGRVPVDVVAGLRSNGYVTSRLVWCTIGIGLAAVAGLLYRSPKAASQKAPKRSSGGAPGRAAAMARRSAQPWLGSLRSEAEGMVGGRRMLLVLASLAAAGALLDYRHFVSPAILLWLIFAVPREAGRWQSLSLRSLALTAGSAASGKWSAFIAAGALIPLLLSLPAAVGHGSVIPILLGLATGAAATSIGAGLAIVTRSAVVPRLALMVLWYAYFAS
ncbi:hypothetical protein [Sphingosinicella sp. BN140058]|uniref:hypothetical protein n=1 Tax=Sphingosinicella sp. BN140058 TaxID=1892855 RepID=UPI0010111452|nr:hypothetical protein [Sphingosinicella sp. BN140058]QAY78400.1 hypothetical protein ETR14_19055 [Sphingosinicella sp. BN140058]